VLCLAGLGFAGMGVWIIQTSRAQRDENRAQRSVLESVRQQNRELRDQFDEMNAYLKVRDEWITEENTHNRLTHARILRLLRELQAAMRVRSATDPATDPLREDDHQGETEETSP
jgi:hypothetical protein